MYDCPNLIVEVLACHCERVLGGIALEHVVAIDPVNEVNGKATNVREIMAVVQRQSIIVVLLTLQKVSGGSGITILQISEVVRPRIQDV